MEKEQSVYLAWKEKLAVELKGRDLKDFDYIWGGTSISPFDERKGIPINFFPRKKAGWLIGATCKLTNESILHALQFGAQMVSVELSGTHKTLAAHFKDIKLDWIELEVDIGDADSINNLYSFLKKQKLENTAGAVISPYVNQYDLYSDYSALLPNYKFLSFGCIATDTALQLADKFNKLIQLIEKLSPTNKLHHILSNVIIRFTPGTDLVLNMSMIRAFRLVWMHILKSFDQDVFMPLAIHCYVNNNREKPTDNMILSTAAGVACIAGGADALFIEAPDPSKSYKAWHLKIQHILKEESQFDKIQDPLAGTFLLERLTTIIAEKIWALV